MKPDDVIESYVRDVAVQLPVKQRADVAAELRSLLMDELNGGDEAAAIALVRRFGRPSDVAARYHAPYAVVDPADTRSFVLAAVVGALLIPTTNQRLPISVDQNTASTLFLSWLGALVLLFALKSWAARRWPSSFQWKPSKVRDDDRAPLFEQIPMIAILVFYEAAYLLPGPMLHFFSAGHVDAAAVTYTADFQEPLRMWWFALFVPMLVGLELWATIAGRWTRVTRTLEIILFLCAGVQLGWHASYGDIFTNPAADQSARLTFQILGAAFELTGVFKIYREWGRIPPRGERLTTAHA